MSKKLNLVNLSLPKCKKLLIAIIYIQSACTYKFALKTKRKLPQIRSVAVEQIVDRGSVPQVQGFLWLNLQRSIIKNTQLSIKSRKAADALLFITIEDASTKQTNSTSYEERRVLSSIYDESTGKAWPLSKYNNLQIADQYNQNRSLNLRIKLKLIKKSNMSNIIDRTYVTNGSHKIFDGKTASYGHFVKSFESLDQLIDRLSKQISTSFINDLLY